MCDLSLKLTNPATTLSVYIPSLSKCKFAMLTPCAIQVDQLLAWLLHVSLDRIADQLLYWFLFLSGLPTLSVSPILPVHSSCQHFVILSVGHLNWSPDMSIQSMLISTMWEDIDICTLSKLLVDIHTSYHSWWHHSSTFTRLLHQLGYSPLTVSTQPCLLPDQLGPYLSQFVWMTNTSFFYCISISACLLCRSSG